MNSAKTDKKQSILPLSIDKLKIGMYIEDILDSEGTLLISRNNRIENSKQIENLRKKGILTVYVNTEKSLGQFETSINKLEDFFKKDSVTLSEYEKEYYAEIEVAKKLHSETIKLAIEALNSFRSGPIFPLNELRAGVENIVSSILRNSDALVSLTQMKTKDEYTYRHSVNVSILMTSFAKQVGYKDDHLVEIALGGILHDVGKMRIPERIINKAGKLTDSEFAVAKRHAEFGIEMISSMCGISDISKKIIIQHHERFNGSGYPLGISGDRINKISSISAISDVYDALTSDRAYKEAWTPQQALAFIFQQSDVLFEGSMVQQFAKHVGIFPVGSFVKLASGELGIIICINKDSMLAPQMLAPQMLILFDATGKRTLQPRITNLSECQSRHNGDKWKIIKSLDPRDYDVSISDYIATNIAKIHTD